MRNLQKSVTIIVLTLKKVVDKMKEKPLKAHNVRRIPITLYQRTIVLGADFFIFSLQGSRFLLRSLDLRFCIYRPILQNEVFHPTRNLSLEATFQKYIEKY